MLPFSSEVLFALFAQYNHAIWPAQIAAYGLGILAMFAVYRPFAGSGRMIALILAAFWLWNGAVYHWTHFASINFAAPAFAAIFVLEGLLFAWTGVVRGKLAFGYRAGLAGWAGSALALYAMAIYPLTNWLAGHAWPEMAIFGVAPCPTTIFTLGLLALTQPHVPWHLLGVPLAWSLIGGSTAWLLDVPQDLALAAAGLMVLGLALVKNLRTRRITMRP